MGSENLVVPKQLSEVSLWVHPEGIVKGCLFLGLEYETMRPEDPALVLNDPSPFIVVRRDELEEIRFYNKNSITRVQYSERAPSGPEIRALTCMVHLMDGSVLPGAVRRALPPANARLYDFLNLPDERFAKLYLEGDTACLINKSYIVRVTEEAGG